MGLTDILYSLVSTSKKLDVKKLPSQGFFYPSDLSMKIKKANIEDVIEYEHNFSVDNLLYTIECIKKIVKNNIILNKHYVYEHIKSVDVIYLFIEIVKYTTNKTIKISYFDELLAMDSYVEFDQSTFNYFDFSKYVKYYDQDTREFVIDGYKFSLPSIGVENCLTQFLLSKSDDEADRWNNYSYNFIYFVGNKINLTFDEIDNILTIFNYEMTEIDVKKTNDVGDIFSNIIGYSLIKNGKVIEVKSKLNLSKIWQ